MVGASGVRTNDGGLMTQRDRKWIEDRFGLVTASRFADAMAGTEKKRYLEYLDQLIDERIGLINFEDWIEKPWFRPGKDMEPRAIAAYAFYIGGLWPNAELDALPDFIRHPTVRAGCSPDVTLKFTGVLGGGAEIKCRASAETQYKVVSNGIESGYKPQVQGAMWVTGAKWWHAVSYCEDGRLDPAHRLHVETIKRDDAYIARIEAAVLAIDAHAQREAEEILRNLD